MQRIARTGTASHVSRRTPPLHGCLELFAPTLLQSPRTSGRGRQSGGCAGAGTRGNGRRDGACSTYRGNTGRREELKAACAFQRVKHSMHTHECGTPLPQSKAAHTIFSASQTACVWQATQCVLAFPQRRRCRRGQCSTWMSVLTRRGGRRSSCGGEARRGSHRSRGGHCSCARRKGNGNTQIGVGRGHRGHRGAGRCHVSGEAASAPSGLTNAVLPASSRGSRKAKQAMHRPRTHTAAQRAAATSYHQARHCKLTALRGRHAGRARHAACARRRRADTGGCARRGCDCRRR